MELPEDVDTGSVEAELIDELREAEGGLSMRADLLPYGGGMADVRLAPVDERAEAAWEGAKEALAEREAELRAFIQAHVQEFAEERAPRAREAATFALAAARAQREAARDIEGELDWWKRLDRDGGLDGALLRDLPGNPFEGVPMTVREVSLPMPQSFVPEDVTG